MPVPSHSSQGCIDVLAAMNFDALFAGHFAALGLMA
jgi:hypothetical protein